MSTGDSMKIDEKEVEKSKFLQWLLGEKYLWINWILGFILLWFILSLIP